MIKSCKNLYKARAKVLLYNLTKNTNVLLANRKNPNFPTPKVVGCKSPTLKRKGGKRREILSPNLERKPA